MPKTAIFVVLLSVFGCQRQPTRYPANAFKSATPVIDPAPQKPVVVEVPPRQAPSIGPEKPKLPAPSSPKTSNSPIEVVESATRSAVRAPGEADYFNAIAQFPYEPGTLYQVYAAPLFVTDIALEPGEKLVSQPASGDSVRWILGVGKSIEGGVPQTHIYVKPTREGLRTNLAINTNKRTYLLELQSSDGAYMAAVKWHYPQDEIAKLELQAAESAAEQKSSAPVVSLTNLNFHYAVHTMNGEPRWKPTQVFDDGRRTFIRFPPAMNVSEAPALFVLRDGQTQLVNYRVKGQFYVIDRLVDEAELRLGQQEQEIVRIVRRGSSADRAPSSARRGTAQRVLGYTLGGLGVVGLGVGVGFTLLRQREIDRAEAICPPPSNVCPPGMELGPARSRLNEHISNAQTAGTVATIGFAAGGAALATGIVLVLTAPRAHSDAAQTALRIAPWFAANGSGVLVARTF